MDIRLHLGAPHRELRVSVEGRLDVHNAAEFQQVMSHLHGAAGPTFTCDLSRTQIVDAAGRSAVESVRRHTEEYGGQVQGAADGDSPLPAPEA